MNREETNWEQSVAGVVIRDGCVLLARHTYGAGLGKRIVPGGYVNRGETPQEALKREFLEKTGISVEPRDLIGIRFNMHDWYAVFRADYVAGEARSDGDENSEVVWLPIQDALAADDVPDLTKKLIESAIAGRDGLRRRDYVGSTQYAPLSFYGV
ncbi:MAG: NUDIX hydrolase [Ruminococcaceae bacterium]|nr:NUDIX hydrolase [Oscillospiraceae bacterium]